MLGALLDVDLALLDVREDLLFQGPPLVERHIADRRGFEPVRWAAFAYRPPSPARDVEAANGRVALHHAILTQ